MNAIFLYRRFLGNSFRSQMEYRASFVIQSFANFLITGIEFIAILALFDRFGQVLGWSVYEVAILYGLVNSSFAVSEGISSGFDTFQNLIKNGGFDRLLIRPRSLILQILGQHLAWKNVGRFLQGAAILIWGIIKVNIIWSVGKAVLLFAAFVGGMILFLSLIIVQATMCFWTVESLEMMNTMTYGGVQTAQYPLSIYPQWLRRFFILIVPLGCVTYLPVLAILGRPAPLGIPAILLWISPLGAGIFLIVALFLWQIGVRHYSSTGS